MSTIHIGNAGSKKVSFDLATLIETRLLVQANSGGGKSWALRRLLEQTHGKVQQIVIDLEGEFSSLREKHDYVIAGKDADAATDPRSANLLARKLMELQVSAICDIYELKSYDRVKFVRTFLESLLSCPRSLWHPVIVVVDEAHHFCPEKGQCEAAQAVIDLCTRGRKRGLCAVLATQRLSKLHKDAAAETLNKLVGRTGLDIDQARAADELGITNKTDRRELRNLQPGEFHAYGPALRVEGKAEGGVILVKVGAVQSTHPHVGARRIDAPPAPTDAIRKVLAELKDLPEQADKEARDLVTLQRDLAEAKREIIQLQSGQAPICNHEGEIAQLKVDIAAATSESAQLKGKLMRAVAVFSDGEKVFNQAKETLTQWAAEVPQITKLPVMPALPRQITPAPAERRAVERKEWAGLPVPRPTPLPAPDTKLSGPQQKILGALAQFEALGLPVVNRITLAAQAGYAANGGAFNNPLGNLRTLGLVEYPGDGTVTLTDAGRRQVDPVSNVLSLAELHERFLQILDGPKRKLLAVILEAHPQPLTREELAETVGYSPNGGAFNNPLGRLRSMGLVTKKGLIAATDVLFPEGLR